VFRKVLIANRGAIACRIIRTLKRMQIGSVAIYSEADAGARHVSMADEAVLIGPAPAAQSYLNIDAVLDAARTSGAEAIHPGYGFLSESVAFAQACEAAGVVFIGPDSETLRMFGLKHAARALAKAHGVPLASGADLLENAEAAVAAAKAVGFPIMLKATAGGGGIGMRICRTPEEVGDGFAAVSRLGAGNFGDGGVFLERYIENARHIEVQIFGDGAGRVVVLGERDCSLQRRNQKVIEETPAPDITDATRAALFDAAVKLGEAANYRSAGTVEFLCDRRTGEVFFLEVNARLQVEHGVTEQVTGVDLVEWMVRGGAGDYSFLPTDPLAINGASIQARLYAEDPGRAFRPSAGRLTEASFPSDARVETWVSPGADISAHYDPLLAKIIVHAPDRAAAVLALQRALDETALSGIETNLEWLRVVSRLAAFVTGDVSTSALSGVDYHPDDIQVVSGGPATTLQDHPGRLGYWDVGVPPSGPMDDLGFRLGNRLLGNVLGAPGLEFAAAGPTLRFNAQRWVCLAGADFGAELDGVLQAPYRPFPVAAGQILKIGRVRGEGLRGYLLVEGGLSAPAYLGSRSTFTLGGFGGHGGRVIAAGDVLHLNAKAVGGAEPERGAEPPTLTHAWTLRVLLGPHGAPDFFTEGDLRMIASTAWRVHYNSNRTGVRLIGPKPEWARRDGGEAGLHPSNIHDNPYAVGAVDFTGDMPIILGPDGPSLGGFVCPYVVILADLWKIGQLAPGDTVTFIPVSDEAAIGALAEQDARLRDPIPHAAASGDVHPSPSADSPVLLRLPAQDERPEAIYRRQGDGNLLVEYGPITLDLELRLRVHALMLEVEALALPGVIDVTPGIRSLQIHFDPHRLERGQLLEALVSAEDRLGGLEDFEIPSRIVHLPLSWKDPAIYQTIEKYIQSVRDDAPWCPDNIEFIRRINGLESIEAVRDIVFNARYLVMGLGDVYLGAPVATPIDPRHRLVTTKYNPARTWTPPNVVGIGGAYMCIYGMEGPGGYQLFGRTIQVWNTYQSSPAFQEGKPWLLRFFDQIRFFPVSADELVEWRRDFPQGRRTITVEHEVFRLRDHRAFLREHKPSIDAFEARREAAFAEERRDWEARGEFSRVEALSGLEDAVQPAAQVTLPPGSDLVESPLGGSLWKLNVAVGDRVGIGTVVAVVEAMKAECEIASAVEGVVTAIYAAEGQPVAPGAPLVAVSPR